REQELASRAFVDAEVALVVVDGFSGAISVEVEHARRRHRTRIVVAVSLPTVVQAHAAADRLVADGGRIALTVHRASTTWIALRVGVVQTTILILARDDRRPTRAASAHARGVLQ